MDRTTSGGSQLSAGQGRGQAEEFETRIICRSLEYDNMMTDPILPKI